MRSEAVRNPGELRRCDSNAGQLLCSDGAISVRSPMTRSVPMRRLLLATALVLACSASYSFSSPAFARTCHPGVQAAGATAVYIQAVRTSCKRARAVARRWLKQAEGNAGPPPRPYGFRCKMNPYQTGFDCRKGRKRVSWMSSEGE